MRAIASGAIVAGAVVLPVFAQDVPDTNPNTSVVPTVPQEGAPVLPPPEYQGAPPLPDMRLGQRYVRIPAMRFASTTIGDGMRQPMMPRRIFSTTTNEYEGGYRGTGMGMPRGTPFASTTEGFASGTESLGKASELSSGLITSMRANAQSRINTAKQKAQEEIIKRVQALTALQNRIGQMTQLSDADKSSLTQELATQIASLSALKDSIFADTSTTTLKTDAQSITKSFRTFALVIPKGSITAAADRIDSTVSAMQTVGTKLKALLDASASSGASIPDAQTAYSDYLAKIADAQSQADAARSEVASLQPDNGDSTVYQSNVKTLQDANKKIAAAQADLKAARADITKIRTALASTPPSGSAAASGSSGNTQ